MAIDILAGCGLITLRANKEACMPVTVRFMGMSPITGTGPGAGPQVWSYAVEGDPPLNPGTWLALGFPAALDL
jgi:hypothetical protein